MKLEQERIADPFIKFAEGHAEAVSDIQDQKVKDGVLRMAYNLNRAKAQYLANSEWSLNDLLYHSGHLAVKESIERKGIETWSQALELLGRGKLAKQVVSEAAIDAPRLGK